MTTGVGVVERAKKKFPILGKLNVKGVESIGQQDYMLEFWNENDSGSEEEPRPEGIPQGSIGVQIFDKKTKPIDVLADVTSHYLVNNDPTVKKLYNQFKNSLTPEQEERLKKDYEWAKKNEGETRPFEQWKEQVRIPAYFRGYTFKQWPDSFNKKVFTKDQIELFNKVRNYLGIH